MEHKHLLSQALDLWRERGSDNEVAKTLVELSDANMQIGLDKEGIQQGKEALEIFERLGDKARQADCLTMLAWLFQSDAQSDAAEEAAFRAIDLLPEKGQKYRACGSHRVLGDIYESKGETEKAIHHFEVVIGIASSCSWHHELFLAHYKLTGLFLREGRFDDTQTHIEHAKSHAVNNAYLLGHATKMQAWIWYQQHRLEEARSEVLCAADLFKKLGIATDMEDCRKILRDIEEELDTPVTSGQSGFNSELL